MNDEKSKNNALADDALNDVAGGQMPPQAAPEHLNSGLDHDDPIIKKMKMRPTNEPDSGVQF